MDSYIQRGEPAILQALAECVLEAFPGGPGVSSQKYGLGAFPRGNEMGAEAASQRTGKALVDYRPSVRPPDSIGAEIVHLIISGEERRGFVHPLLNLPLGDKSLCQLESFFQRLCLPAGLKGHGCIHGNRGP